MADLKLDHCRYCAALTRLGRYTVETAVRDLESGDLGCWLCREDGDRGAHVWLYDGERVVWRGWDGESHHAD